MKRRMLVSIIAVILIASTVLIACSQPAPAPSPAPKATTPTASPAPTAKTTAPTTSTPTPSPSPKATVRLIAASTETTSSVYGQQVAMVDIINKYVPGVQVTLVEGGGSEKATQMLQAGTVQLALSCSPDATRQAMAGTGGWEGKPKYTDVRFMVMKAMNRLMMIVREDSGVKTLQDLEGKAFSFGLPGSADAKRSEDAFKVLGIKPKVFTGSYADAIRAMKDRQIVGIAKSGTGAQLDAQMLEVSSFTKVRIIGYSEADIAKIKKDPYMQFTPFVVLEKGENRALPDQGGVSLISSLSGTGTDKKIPADIIYGITKAWAEHWGDIVKAYDATKEVDPVKDTIRGLVIYDPVAALHPGTIRYLKEKGATIPDKLIPPEYQK